MRRLVALALLLLIGGCVKPPVQDEVTIVLHEDDRATITARTTFDDALDRTRTDAARSAAIAGTDAWSARLARLSPDTDRVTFERTRGQLERVTRTAVVPAKEIERLFADSSIGVQLVQAEGYQELHFYPGASGRATREEQRHFDEALASWSRDAALYFQALHEVYAYLDAHPQRRRFVFAAILSEKGPDGAPPGVIDDEEPLVRAVTEAMDRIAARMDEDEPSARRFAEEADRIFNPFPARLSVEVPGDIVAREGFSGSSNRTVTIEPADLYEALASLEGKWARPDPLAALLRRETVKAEDLARLPRESEPMVRAADVAEAVRERLTRPRAYRIRWR